jgi:hypothetical protein
MYNFVTYRYMYIRTCRNPECDAAICEETMKPVQIGAGLRLHADCTIGHRTTWDSCEFTNKTRTSIIDIMISTFQLTIGLNMSQVCLSKQFVSKLISLRSVKDYARFIATLYGLCHRSGKI